jgi:hypothetical protein
MGCAAGVLYVVRGGRYRILSLASCVSVLVMLQAQYQSLDLQYFYFGKVGVTQ